MELLLAVAQKAVAPGDGRAQRSLPLGKVDRPFHLESEPFVECLEDAIRREDDEARRDELDRERQAVQATADLPHRRKRVGLEDDAAGRGELDEQRLRIVHGQRRETEHVLARQLERCPARGEDVEVRNEVEQTCDVPRGRREVLEVVEEEQRARAAERVRDGLDERSARRLACAHRARDLGKDEGRVRDRGQADQVNRSLDGGRCRRLQGEPTLAGSTRAGDGHEPHVGAAEQRLDRRQVVLTADESMMQRRQRRSAERPAAAGTTEPGRLRRAGRGAPAPGCP